jgi:hypothetical protein
MFTIVAAPNPQEASADYNRMLVERQRRSPSYKLNRFFVILTRLHSADVIGCLSHGL